MDVRTGLFACFEKGSCLNSFLIMTVLAWLSACAVSAPTTVPPTPARWHSPCSGGTIASFRTLDSLMGSITMPTVDTHVHYKNIHERALVTKELVVSLKTHFADHRIQDSKTRDFLETLNLQGMPHVDPANPVNIDPATTNVADFLKSMYEDLARVTVFLEQARLDELNYEKSYGTDVVHEVQQIENTGVYPTLCDLQLAMRAHNVKIDVTITREIMKREFRDLASRSLRYQRDYVMLHGFNNVLHQRSEHLATLIEYELNKST